MLKLVEAKMASHKIAGYFFDYTYMDIEYITMRRRMSRLRVKCGKLASLEGKPAAVHSHIYRPIFIGSFPWVLVSPWKNS